MSNANHADPPPPDADPRIARAEQRLAMLRELAEIGMAMTRRLARRTLEAPDDDAVDPAPAEAAGGRDASKSAPKAAPGPRHDPAESFARISRAVRLTLAFEAKTDDHLAELRAGGKDRAAPGRRRGAAANDDGDYDDYDDDDDDDDDDGRLLPPAKDYPSPRRNLIRDRVHDAINAEVRDVYRAHEVLDDLYERLTEGERYDTLVDLPLREAVEAICDDLGLRPDWSRWTGEGWAPPPPNAPRYRWQSCWAPGASRPVLQRRRQ